jgi:NAD(P)H-dependent FMN reductase
VFHLQILIASTRPTRKGPAVASWFLERAQAHGQFELELVDLQAVGLPVYDEPNHPRLKQYEHEHTKRWSAIVDRADAFVFVTPEYNFSAPPSLTNAITYLAQEWAYKPVAFVSYGGMSAGTRSVQMTKALVTTFNMMPIADAVNLHQFTKLFAEDGRFVPGEVSDKAAAKMLSELHRWTAAMQQLRKPREA